ncbi:hypothetical protein [Pedobacter alpinus]|uniref:Uncharacterized protein n=1 Tax=Pedobacter alpinus TaxID=1590643 RepID=A0ABW5TV30_9SPHI
MLIIKQTNTFAGDMLKRFICIFLVILMGISTFTRLFYFAGYEINKDYIAKVLCINKNVPELNCNGKCFLSKKIAEAEKKEQSAERNTQKDITQQVMLISTFNFLFKDTQTTILQKEYLNNYSLLNYSSFFQPPRFLSNIYSIG